MGIFVFFIHFVTFFGLEIARVSIFHETKLMSSPNQEQTDFKASSKA